MKWKTMDEQGLRGLSLRNVAKARNGKSEGEHIGELEGKKMRREGRGCGLTGAEEVED